MKRITLLVDSSVFEGAVDSYAELAHVGDGAFQPEAHRRHRRSFVAEARAAAHTGRHRGERCIGGVEDPQDGVSALIAMGMSGSGFKSR